jgi:ferredoxin-NADP reductase
MARAALPGRLMPPTNWQPATIVNISQETETAKTFRFRLEDSSTHLPGQHYVLKLTGPDGYTTSRSYSVASAPDGSNEIELTIERLPGGEVSTFLHDEATTGDEFQVRGPIGGWFVWTAEQPALLIAGGSGVVPLMAMLRYSRQHNVADLVRLIVSVRAPDRLYYAHELPGPQSTVIYTRAEPSGQSRPPGRINPGDLEPLLLGDATVYICGSSPFADAATDAATSIGVDVGRIRVERFGPTG